MQYEIIERALGGAAADDVADATVVATATARALSLLLGELKPLIGDTAARALYVRSLHLARSSLQRPVSAADGTHEELLAPLHQDLASRAPNDAVRASRALLHSVADLLVSLIGAPITHRLLKTAWDVPTSRPPLEEKPR